MLRRHNLFVASRMQDSTVLTSLSRVSLELLQLFGHSRQPIALAIPQRGRADLQPGVRGRGA